MKIALCAMLLPFTMSAATFVVSTKNDSGAGSLRQAILDANANAGADVITFNIAGAAPYQIIPNSALPDITDTVLIDGTTQPGYAGVPLVVLVGTSAGAVNGLTISLTYGCEVRGLTINRFRSDGLRLDRGGRHVIAANFLGTSQTGNASAGNRYAGLTIFNSASNRIGGATAAERNIISGNDTGIYITGAAAKGNRIQGNFIGTDVDGVTDVGNTNNGVLLVDAVANTIGGSTAGERNVISGNNQCGVYLYGTNTTLNQISGNFIGTTVSGIAGLSNKIDGITLDNAPGNLIGGAASGQGNIISANRERGIYLVESGAISNRIEGNWIGLAYGSGAVLGNRYSGVGLTNASFNTIGGTNTGAGNVISGNQQSGVAIAGPNSAGNVVLGNRIGTDPAGTGIASNWLNGVVISQGTNNVIGGGAPAARNTISGNSQSGVYLQGGVGSLVAGNYIGTDVSGRLPLRNRQNGVRIDCSANVIGGSSAGQRNVISANTSSAVYLYGSAASNNVIVGNFLGTDVTGTNALGNGGAGIGITNAPRNFVGGTGSFDGNVISGNTDSGIYIGGSGASSNRIQGNLIGTDATGTRALPNSYGGIYIYGSPGNFIGSSSAGAGNVISGNLKDGISIGDAGANGNVMCGNYIGVQQNGTGLLGNQWHGIEILAGSSNIIGRTSAGSGNRIAGAQTAGYDGVRVRDAAIATTIRGNSIFSNGSSAASGLAVDLGVDGVTANDSSDADTGANGLQNFPALQSAYGRFITTISGTLNSRPNAGYTIDFYGNTLSEPSGYGEGERWLGAVTVTTAANGNATIIATLTNLFGAGSWLAATATDSAGSTSEFSPAISVTPIPDANGDGVPDDFALAAGWIGGMTPGTDTDGDGMPDLAEFAAGTNPRDPASVLSLTLNVSPGAVALHFASVPGKVYTVESALTIAGPWKTVADQMAGTGGGLRVTDGSMTAGKFYRLRVN